jgi:glyoxylase-like metal-dependent hydrolase (beta-lactamase superfamily II)
MVIDPGDDPDLILSKLKAQNLILKQIVCTHTHIDHVGAIFELQQKAGTPASIHHADLFLFEELETQAQWLGMPAPRRGTIDSFLKDGSTVGCSGIELGVLHTPGHTPGSSCFLLNNGRKILFAGDTSLPKQHRQNRSLGRVDAANTFFDSQQSADSRRRHISDRGARWLHVYRPRAAQQSVSEMMRKNVSLPFV